MTTHNLKRQNLVNSAFLIKFLGLKKQRLSYIRETNKAFYIKLGKFILYDFEDVLNYTDSIFNKRKYKDNYKSKESNLWEEFLNKDTSKQAYDVAKAKNYKKINIFNKKMLVNSSFLIDYFGVTKQNLNYLRRNNKIPNKDLYGVILYDFSEFISKYYKTTKNRKPYTIKHKKVEDKSFEELEKMTPEERNKHLERIHKRESKQIGYF